MALIHLVRGLIKQSFQWFLLAQKHSQDPTERQSRILSTHSARETLTLSTKLKHGTVLTFSIQRQASVVLLILESPLRSQPQKQRLFSCSVLTISDTKTSLKMPLLSTWEQLETRVYTMLISFYQQQATWRKMDLT